jgi:hypothetical protein
LQTYPLTPDTICIIFCPLDPFYGADTALPYPY